MHLTAPASVLWPALWNFFVVLEFFLNVSSVLKGNTENDFTYLGENGFGRFVISETTIFYLKKREGAHTIFQIFLMSPFNPR
jgi:hypothetical protein